MSIQGVGSPSVLTQLHASLTAGQAAKGNHAVNDSDGDKDHGAIDSNDGGSGTKGRHINVKA